MLSSVQRSRSRLRWSSISRRRRTCGGFRSPPCPAPSAASRKQCKVTRTRRAGRYEPGKPGSPCAWVRELESYRIELRLQEKPWSTSSPSSVPVSARCVSVPSGLYTRATRRSGSITQRSEEHTSELQSRLHLVCRLLLEKKKKEKKNKCCINRT